MPACTSGPKCGGEIFVNGNAADWVGAEMHGGRIHVKGNAGHLVGAVYRGGRRGMTAGEILIGGDAGNEIGHTMRRGLIAVGGKTGDAAGFNLIAGSILLFGETGKRPGRNASRDHRSSGNDRSATAVTDLSPDVRLSARFSSLLPGPFERPGLFRCGGVPFRGLSSVLR